MNDQATGHPDLEDLLREVASKPPQANTWKVRKALVTLDKLILLTVKKLYTLQQLRDSIAQRYYL